MNFSPDERGRGPLWLRAAALIIIIGALLTIAALIPSITNVTP